MHSALDATDEMFRQALGAYGQGREALYEALRAVPAPIYVTDAEGWVIFANEPCLKFSGRRPAIGKDRWCVTWKLYTEDGEFLPHDQCPMATAIQEKRPNRGLQAVAERPDGTRVTFMPFPTPLLDEQGELVGAVNMLIDVTEIRQIEELKRQAEHCRWLARGIGDASTKATL
ncbi:MAG TPA: PAS domain-containing protein, partial [Phenylobacterium sp.]|nr:PAS domain-containing protein [Phenylobacterium sp.]